MKVKIYHNSRCSKSRQTLEILENKNCDIEIVEYLKVPMSLRELKDILSKLNYLPATTSPSIIMVGEFVEYSNSKSFAKVIF